MNGGSCWTVLTFPQASHTKLCTPATQGSPPCTFDSIIQLYKFNRIDDFHEVDTIHTSDSADKFEKFEKSDRSNTDQ